MKRRAAAPLLAAALLLPLAGCSSGVLAPRTSNAANADLAEIKQRLVEIQRQATITRVEVEELRRRVETLEAAAGIRRSAPPASTPPRTPASNPPSQAPPRQRDVTETRPPAPLAEPALEENDVVAADAPPPDASDAVENGAEGGTQAISAAGQALYDRGYTLYHQGRYLDAEATFQRFLQGNGATDLADNAQYWIGESRYSRRDFAGALAAFREVVARYPRGNKVPDALLKAGQSLEELGDGESARASYREVIDRFPGSAASAVAEERLSHLP